MPTDHSPAPRGEPVLLVCVPYAPLERPSMGLSVLKAGLAQRGIGCQVVYSNLVFADRIGVHEYDLISRTNSNELAGDWTFRAAAFPDTAADDEAFFAHIAGGLESFAHLLHKMGGRGTMRALVEQVASNAVAHIRTMAERVVSARPRVVGCGSTFQQHMAALALLREVKRLDPGIVTVMGGANCEAEMGIVTHRECAWLDFVVSGEAEDVFPELCKRILASGAGTEISGLPVGVIGPVHRRSSLGGHADLMRRPPRAVLADMNNAPIPDFSDYFAWLEATVASRIEPGLMMETSRGCWWGAVSHCTFCGLNGENMGYRHKSPERVVQEIETLAGRHGVSRIYTVDNILPHDYLTSVVPALAAAGSQVHLFYETKSNLKRAQVELLAKANIRWIQPGIESFDDGILKTMRKGTTGRQNIQVLKWAREFGINFYWLLLYDFPGESDDDYVAMAEWLPLVAHLQPPRALSFVQYVRFSPYERQREQYGLNLESERAYHWLYPWSKKSIDAFAYYFEDYTVQRDRIEFHHDQPLRRPGLAALRATFLSWSEQWPHFGLDGRESMAMLYMNDSGEALTITDTRRCAPVAGRILTGIHRAICLTCHDAPPEQALASRLEAGFGVVTDADAVRRAVADLIEWKLVLRMGTHLIGLPLLGRPRPMPPWTEYPGGRILSHEECAVRDHLPMLGLFASLAANGLGGDRGAGPDPLSIAAVIANCWLDRGFQSHLVDMAAPVLAASGVSLPSDMTVRILVDEPRRLHLVLGRSALDEALRLDSLPPAPSFLQVYSYVYEAARRDESFRRTLLVEPGRTLRGLGIDLGDDFDVVVCEADAHRAYLSIPTVEQMSMGPWKAE